MTEFGKIGLGSKDSVKLKPAKVKILGFKSEEVQKEGKKVGTKIALICTHPDKESVEISGVTFISGKKVKTTGMWLQLDEDRLIAKSSALAHCLNYLKVANLDEVTGKEVDTETDEKGYLCIKAY